MEYIFEIEVSNLFIDRINSLHEDITPQWGKMNCAQMLAHCAGAYEESSSRLNIFSKTMIKYFQRDVVIGQKPYPKGMKTSKKFVVDDDRDFNEEKERLLAGIHRIQELGSTYFNGKKHPIFGKLSVQEWNIFFTKHLDHHLRQFGV